MAQPHTSVREAGAAVAVPFLGAFESTYLPGHGLDVLETTGHLAQWRRDLDADIATGVGAFRYPLPWHRIEVQEGRYDWHATDEALEHLRARGVAPVADLLHHTSHPGWLTDGMRDRRFPGAFVRFAEAVGRRYPWLGAYTVANEPFATTFLAGHEALWPPYGRGVEAFARVLTSVLPAVSEASAVLRELLPGARHVWVDTCEHHDGSPGGPRRHAELANDRRFAVLDLALGHDLDDARPFLGELLRHGGARLLDLAPVQVDQLGLDYYCHSEWWYDHEGGHTPSPHPAGFAAVAAQYHERYGLPLLLAETNLRGLPTDRASWLRYVLEQYEIAVGAGLPLEGFCWFPSVDSCDWDSLLARPGGRTDPVGVRELRGDGTRGRTAFTDAWEAAVAGATSAELPAYRFQPPCDEQLAGFVRGLDHWPWQDPPDHETTPAIHIPSPRKPEPMTRPDTPDPRHLVVLSHLRWTGVWQRPQHLVSRFAARRALGGARTWFVEEPEVGAVAEAHLRTDAADGVTRVRLVIPAPPASAGHPGFDVAGAEAYGPLLRDLLSDAGVDRPDVLLYTPMALDIAEALAPGRLFYDVMDDLASFKDAPRGLALRHRRVLTEADVAFAGGRSLHRSVTRYRTRSTMLVPSGVEAAHFARAEALRTEHHRPVAGYVGVVDERVDLALLAGLAEELPEWTVRVVGPVAKIDPAELPRAENLEYPGSACYADLPAVLAGFDVALMPFALNEATRSISPTKTLEYLAAGLPVVSTRVPDVVADHSAAVTLADDAPAFAAACRQALLETAQDRRARARLVSRRHEWDLIAERMDVAMDQPASLDRAGAQA